MLGDRCPFLFFWSLSSPLCVAFSVSHSRLMKLPMIYNKCQWQAQQTAILSLSEPSRAWGRQLCLSIKASLQQPLSVQSLLDHRRPKPRAIGVVMEIVAYGSTEAESDGKWHTTLKVTPCWQKPLWENRAVLQPICCSCSSQWCSDG